MLITALGDLQVFITASGCHNSFMFTFRHPVQVIKKSCLFSGTRGTYRLFNFIIAAGSDNGVHLRNFLQDFFLVALCHTAGDDQRLTDAVLLHAGQIQDGLNALFFGGINKTAGIDDNNICLCLIVRHGKASAGQFSQHMLRIHQIFVASERHK